MTKLRGKGHDGWAAMRCLLYWSHIIKKGIKSVRGVEWPTNVFCFFSLDTEILKGDINLYTQCSHSADGAAAQQDQNQDSVCSWKSVEEFTSRTQQQSSLFLVFILSNILSWSIHCTCKKYSKHFKESTWARLLIPRRGSKGFSVLFKLFFHRL